MDMWGSFNGTFAVYITINGPSEPQSCWCSVLKNRFLVWEPLLVASRETWPLGGRCEGQAVLLGQATSRSPQNPRGQIGDSLGE